MSRRPLHTSCGWHLGHHPSRRGFRTQDTGLIWKSNLEGTRNLIAAVQTQAPQARFILASTSNVYDMDSSHPGREDDPVEPKLAYPASKVAAENELRASGLTWAVAMVNRADLLCWVPRDDRPGHRKRMESGAHRATFNSYQLPLTAQGILR